MIPDLWHPETVYLNTASFGLPPDPVWDALTTAQEDWRHGRVSWEHWTAVTGRARAQFARLVGADVDRVAVGSTVSGLIAQVAAALPDGTRVLVHRAGVRRRCCSRSWPRSERGVTRRGRAASTGWPRRSTRRTDVVAVSAVQSSTGEVADLDAIAAAARAPRRADRDRCHARDRLAAAGRVALRRGRLRLLQVADVPARHGVPGAERAARRAHDAPPGGLVRRQRPAQGPVRPAAAALPDTARRFDTSPAWFSWVGTEPALRAAQRDRRRGGPRARPARSRTASAPGSASSRRTPRSSPPTSPMPPRSSRGRGSWPPPARAGSARHFTSTTPRPTSTRPSSALLRTRSADSETARIDAGVAAARVGDLERPVAVGGPVQQAVERLDRASTCR